ncbi:MAG: hypothetical protein JSW70_05090, partial [Syntrophobacterales bacterium]
MKWLRRTFFGLILFSLILSLGGMNRSAEADWKSWNNEKKPRVIIVFVDMSGSTNLARATVYRECFEKIYQDLHQKDRIVVGMITGRSFIDF